MSKPIVVGVDGSESARAAAAWASELAAVRGVPLRLVHAVPVTPGAEPPWLREEVDAAARAGVADVAASTWTGAVVEALLSADAEMLVVGSCGPGATSGMLAGFTALTLIGSATCPVAVVRGSGPGLAPPREGEVVVGVDDIPAVALQWIWPRVWPSRGGPACPWCTRGRMSWPRRRGERTGCR